MFTGWMAADQPLHERTRPVSRCTKADLA
jgi:hypothetical protein